MKTRKFQILIQPLEKTLDHFEEMWKLVSKRQSKGTKGLVLCFRDLSMVSKVLSAERLRLLRTIRDQKPVSVNQLATFLGRAQSNVHKDVHYLSQLGIVELTKSIKKGQKRHSIQPKFQWDSFEIAVG